MFPHSQSNYAIKIKIHRTLKTFEQKKNGQNLDTVNHYFILRFYTFSV